MRIDKPLSTHIPELRRLWTEAFGDTDDFLDLFYNSAFSENRCRCITLDDKVISALYWFDCYLDTHKIAYVYAVATSKSHRGQGFGHKLMEDTHSHLKSLGYEGVLLVPGSESLFQYYAGMEYQTCSYIREFDCTGSQISNDENFMISEIDKAQYALLRRQFLPSGGVIQENENLDFLETLAKFYTGDNFLLAASISDHHLYVRELLGDVSAAPYIVSALDCKAGSFRTPGSDRAFAMYHTFYSNKTNPASAPYYFAFAFD